MKDYYKYCTVGQLKQQIQGTLISAKSKLNSISESRKCNDASFISQKFYNYVKEIKSKQKQYDTIMNKTAEIQILLNQRRDRINESLEQYERNKRSKTLNSFQGYHNLLMQQSHNNFYTNSTELRNKLASTYQQPFNEITKENFLTEVNSQASDVSKSILFGKKIKKDKHYLLTENHKGQDSSQSNRLKSITKVVNIRIDNDKNKLYSFAKGTIKSQIASGKPCDQLKTKGVQKQLRFQTVPNLLVQSKGETHKKERKKRAQSTLQHKAIKMIKERIKQNDLNSEVQWQANKKLQNIKSLSLKYQFQKYLRRQLLGKILSSKAIHKKSKY